VQFQLYTFILRQMRYTVYRWEFSYLDYSFDVLISWSRNLGCTAGFAIFALIGFFIHIFNFTSTIIIFYIPDFTTCALLHWSPAITILYIACLLPNITLVLLCLVFLLAYSLIYMEPSYRIISWWFILFYFAVIVDSSACAYSIDGDMRFMVYRWEFSYLEYPFEITISWIYLLSPYNWFYHLCTSHLLVPLSCLGVYDHGTVFNACFWFRFIDTRVLVTWHSPHPSLGSFDSLGSSCPDLGAWNLWIFTVADQSGAAEMGIIGRPSEAPSFQPPARL